MTHSCCFSLRLNVAHLDFSPKIKFLQHWAQFGFGTKFDEMDVSALTSKLAAGQCQSILSWPMHRSPFMSLCRFNHCSEIFSTANSKYMLSVWKIADDWIQTTDLWCQKWLLCQLSHSHNHCPSLRLFWSCIRFHERFDLLLTRLYLFFQQNNFILQCFWTLDRWL